MSAAIVFCGLTDRGAGSLAWSAAPDTTRAVAAAQNPAPTEERALREEQKTVATDLFQKHPSGDSAFALAMVCSEQGDLASAIRYWREGLALPADSVRLHRRAEVLAELGQALAFQGEQDQAEKVLRESLQLQPNLEQARMRLVQLLLEQDRAADGLALLDGGNPHSPGVLVLRGKALQRLGRMAEARESFAGALAVEPNSAEACYGLSVVCARSGAAEDAARYRQRFGELTSRQQELGREFRAALNPLRNTRQSVAMTHTTVGWVLQQAGALDEAERLWIRAAEMDPLNTACRFHLLMRWQRAGRNHDALRVCEEMVRVEPTNAFHRVSQGNLQLRLGRPAEAEAAFRQAHALAPARAETCFSLAQFYLRANTNLGEAVLLAQQAVQVSPTAPHYYLLSRIQSRQGAVADAQAAARRACELEPANRDYEAWKSSLAGSP